MQWEIVSIPSRAWWFIRNLADDYNSSCCLRDVTGQAKYVYSQAITSQMCVNSPRIRVANLTYEEIRCLLSWRRVDIASWITTYTIDDDAGMLTLYISHTCVLFIILFIIIIDNCTAQSVEIIGFSWKRWYNKKIYTICVRYEIKYDTIGHKSKLER